MHGHLKSNNRPIRPTHTSCSASSAGRTYLLGNVVVVVEHRLVYHAPLEARSPIAVRSSCKQRVS